MTKAVSEELHGKITPSGATPTPPVLSLQTMESHEKKDNTCSSSSSDDESDGLFAFQSALQADLHTGKSLPDAVRSLFDGLHEDTELPKKNREKLRRLNLSAPVLSALSNTPSLRNDVHTVAQMCYTVYQLAEDQIESLRNVRERLDLPLESLGDVAELIARAENIIVLAGAGVSVSCGIPDFRSKGGLYDTVLERYGLSDPQAIFDLEEFKMDPSLFYSFAKDVMPDNSLQPSLTHRFVAELQKQGKLTRVYSQNIDGLETRAGVSEDCLVLCHGSFLTATCMRRTCRTRVAGSDIANKVAQGIVPTCQKCNAKGGDDEEDGDDAESMGVLKPDIVFFGESLPKKVNSCLETDVENADLVLVLGTSLQVAPVARIPELFKNKVPRILVNRETVDYDFDIELLGDCDVIVNALKRHLKWDEEEGGKSIGDDNDENEMDVLRFVPPRRFMFKGATEGTEGNDDSSPESD